MSPEANGFNPGCARIFLSPQSVKMKKFTLRASVLCCITAGILWPGYVRGQAPSFNACVSYPSQSAGMYSFSTSGYSPTLIKRDVYASGGGIADDNYYYSTRYEELMGIPVVERKSYSLKNWGLEDSYSGKIEHVATDLAYFAPKDEAYGCFSNETGTGYIFVKYRIGGWSYTKICDLSVAFAALDFSADGTLYAIDWTGVLNIVDKKTGALTPIGDTGVATQVITGGAIDRTTDTFYYSVKTSDQSAIYTVDLSNATATKLYDLANEEQVGGLYFPESYAPGAPGKAYGNPSVSFNGTAMNGTVRFRAPRELYDGSPASGTVTYHVLANGTEVATGEGTYGASEYITADVEFQNADLYCFSVYFENEAGRGPRVKTSQFVGADIPRSPINPRLTYNDGVVKLFWSAAGYTGVNGGNIDRSDFHYLITRYPDGATFTCEQSPLQQELAVPETRVNYYYTIQTVAGAQVSDPVTSPTFGLGPIEPAFTDNFGSNTSSFGWSSLNPDGSAAWEYDGGMKGVTNKAPADNYLVSPQFALKGGRKYEVSISLKRGNSSYNESFSVVAGREKTPEGLSELTIIPQTEISTSDYQTYTGTLEPLHDGNYYIALHADSPNGRYMVMNGISVAAGVSTSAPGAVTDLEAHPDMTGAHKVSFSFVTPTVTLDGASLSDITSVELLRDGVSVKTVADGVDPGTEMTVEDDTEPDAGIYEYTVVCHNGAGAGTPASVEVVIGFNRPEQSSKVTVVETEDPGVVDVSWEPVTQDIDGKTFSEGDVTYDLYNRDNELVKSGMKETFYTVRAGEPNTHTWAQYRVCAVSEGGSSEVAKSMLVPVGKPDASPWHESFANKEVTYPIGTTVNTYGDQWQIVGGFHSPQMGIDIAPVDKDGGMMGLETWVTDESVSLFTGNIDLSATPNPAFSFYVFNYVGSNGLENANKLTIQVCPRHEADFTTVRTLTIGESGPQSQWNKVTVPLDEYEGQTVRLRVQVEVVTAIYAHLDNLAVNTSAESNLAARNLVVPASVNPDTEFTAEFVVTNTGDAKAGNFRVELLMDGEPIASREESNLEAGESRKIDFSYKLGVTAADVHTFAGRVEFAGDMVESDNVTAEAKVQVRRNGLPGATGLVGQVSDGTVELLWNAPDLSNLPPAAATEMFDTSEGWTSEVAGWTFLDLDKATIGGIGKKQIPVSGQQSFFLMDDTHKSLNMANDGDRFKAHSGNQYLCSMYSMRGQTYVQSDDWAISPELYGGPQTISLWASSFEADADQTQYLETFEVLASESGTDTEDFTLIERFENVPPTWTRYEVYLPAGTRHFAIRGVSYDKYMLFVDDVEFIPASAPAMSVALSGYNVWRDGEKIASLPAASTTYSDITAAADKSYRYTVTALYGSEESSPCSEIIVDTAGSAINGVENGRIGVHTSVGKVIVTGGEGLAITLVTVDGRTVATRIGESITEIEAASGPYLLRVGSSTCKIII